MCIGNPIFLETDIPVKGYKKLIKLKDNVYKTPLTESVIYYNPKTKLIEPRAKKETSTITDIGYYLATDLHITKKYPISKWPGEIYTVYGYNPFFTDLDYITVDVFSFDPLPDCVLDLSNLRHLMKATYYCYYSQATIAKIITNYNFWKGMYWLKIISTTGLHIYIDSYDGLHYFKLIDDDHPSYWNDTIESKVKNTNEIMNALFHPPNENVVLDQELLTSLNKEFLKNLCNLHKDSKHFIYSRMYLKDW